MRELLTLKEISELHGISLQRLNSILKQAAITPRKLSNIELRNLQWEGKDKRTLHSVFVEAHVLESVAFKMGLACYKSQHATNEMFGQMSIFFD